ncbi:SPOR domain-containing protein [Aestuariirhabdus sp. LZHN29]|uniref:SPOR domain-containing protein n=1 Tax=Aestuariirhabdus sp. LZHN29 TaxID=3417462 RepID=UPI003CEE2E1A
MSEGANLKVDGKAFRQRLEEALSDTKSFRTVFFSGAGRGDVLAKLDHLTQFSDLMLLVCAPLGAGKSVLYREFISRHEGKGAIVTLEQASTTAPTQLAALLQKQIGFQELPPTVDEWRLLEILQQHLRTPLLLVIDDAQELPGESWQFLFNVVKGARDVGLHIRVVLFADPSVRAMLDLYGADQPLHQLDLQPLDRQSLKEYMDTQQASGRWAELGKFSAASLGGLLKRSQGVIGAAEQLLQDHCDEKTTRSRGGGGLPRAHLLAVVGIIALLLASYLLQGAFDNDPSVQVPEPEVLMEVDAVTAAIPSTSAQIATDGESIDESRQRLLDAVEKLEEKKETPLIAPVDEVGSPATPRETLLPSNVGDNASVDEQQVDEPVAAATIPPVPVSAAAVASAKASKSSPVLSKGAEIVPQPPETVSPPPVDLPSQRWLVSQSSTAYSLQMLGSHQREAVETFIARMGSGSNWHLIETRHRGKAWFIALYGSYTDRETALSAIKSMSSVLQAQKPWARAIAPLQAEYKNLSAGKN